MPPKTSEKVNENSSIINDILAVLFRNFWLKLLSFIFAIVLFFIVRTDKETNFERIAKVQLISSPNLILLGSSERFLNVIVKQQNSIFSMPPSDLELTAKIDITKKSPGRTKIKVTRDDFPYLPKQYTIFIEQPFIDIEMDRLQAKILPIIVPLKGEPKTGLSVDKITVFPQKIEIKGAQQELARLQNLSTIPINIENIDTNLTTNVSLDIDPTTTVTSHEKFVRVTIDLALKKSRKIIPSVPIELKGALKSHIGKLELRPAFVDVEISADEKILKHLNLSSVRVYLDVSNIKPGWQQRQPIVKIPDKSSFVQTVPNLISVYLNQ